MTDPAVERNTLEEAALRYDTDEDFRRTVDGEGAKDLTDADIDFDSLPPFGPVTATGGRNGSRNASQA